MSDFNGRIGEIVSAVEKSGGDLAELRYVIRTVLRAERLDGWKEGYSDGREDHYEGTRAKREAAQAEAEYEWTGTDPRGEDKRGSMRVSRAGLAAVVQDRFESGWRTLRVTLDGREIAGIGPDPEKPGERAVWEGQDA